MLDLPGAWAEWFAEWASDHSFVLINAGLLLLAGWLAARWAAGRVQKFAKQFGRTGEAYQPMAASLVRCAVLSLVVVAALPLVGLPTLESIVLVVAFAGITALAAQGTLRNLTAGAMLQSIRPLSVGDAIEIEGVSGTVTETGLLATSLCSEDGVFISIPNSRLSCAIIHNYSRLGSRRLEITFTVGYDQDIDDVIAVCRDLAESNGRVLRDPPPEVVVSGLRETAVAITVRAWSSSAAHTDAIFHLNREIKKALDTAGVLWAATTPRHSAQPVEPTTYVEPSAYISTAFRSRMRSRAIEP